MRPTIDILGYCVPDFAHGKSVFTPENQKKWEMVWERFKNSGS
jgi:hypothetical protein